LNAAGTLRVGLRGLGRNDRIFPVQDQLGLGPLDSEHARIAFWRRFLFPLMDALPSDEAIRNHGFFQRRRDLKDTLAKQPGTRVLIWASASGADQVRLRMACDALAGTTASVWVVSTPPVDGVEAVEVHSAESLAGLLHAAAELSPATRDSMAAAFKHIASRPEPLRESDGLGQLCFRSMSTHDAAILQACPHHWCLAADVVGAAMTRSDPRNALSDAFIASRLLHLIAVNRIETDAVGGPRFGWRNQLRQRPGGRPTRRAGTLRGP
jgi:hypothetical protein